jgi:hypothetical protein
VDVDAASGGERLLDVVFSPRPADAVSPLHGGKRL